MIYKTFDVVVVPFPFCDFPESKNRPALVVSSTLSFNASCNHTVLAMITSAANVPWPLDFLIGNLVAAGLSKQSMVRMKFFTVSNQLIIKKIGVLGGDDRKKVAVNVKQVFSGMDQAF